MYWISVKDKSCGTEYGRKSFDFSEGVMTFTAPNQVYRATQTIDSGEIEGWMLYFHPDLIRNTRLEKQIQQYTFFKYEVHEALHLSTAEETTVNEVMENIRTEYEQRIDNHSHRVIITNLELLLDYSLRFYERQFNTRTSYSKDVVSVFLENLRDYYEQNQPSENGLPSIKMFAEQAHFSPHYFSDLIKKETGRTPKEHVNEFVVGRAKSLLRETELSVSEIAYLLGFNYPHYFTRLFKSRTGQTPGKFRAQA